MAEKIFTRNFGSPTRTTLRVYRERAATRLGQGPGMEPAAITEEVKKSNLRGLGGAGFPTGVKWGFIPKGSTGAEVPRGQRRRGRAGTFKDRYLLERDPHALIEGMLIAARAIDSRLGFVYIRGEYVKPWRIFSAAVKEAYEAGPARNIQGSGFDFDIVIHRGRAPTSAARRRAPLLARGQEGLAQDQAAVPRDQGRLRAADHREQRGDHRRGAPHHHPRRRVVRRARHQDPGRHAALLGVGHVVRPGVVEAPVSVTLRSLIYDHCGGIRGGRAAQGGGAGRLLGGRSSPPDEIDIAMDVDGPKSKGSMIGSAGGS
jgi:NADH-quinone oxidoreductase subunit F